MTTWVTQPATATTAASTVLVGSTSPTLTLGVCSWEYRIKGVATALRPRAAGTITVRSAYGGEALDVPFKFL
jgi:hypothetical protein